MDRRFDYKCEDGGAVTAGGLCGASAEQLLNQAYALTPVGSSQRIVLSYIIQGQKRLLQNAVAFSEVPEGATITITVEEDPDYQPFREIALQFSKDAKRVVVRNIAPVCYVVGGPCSGKSSLLNTLLGAPMQLGSSQNADPVFAEPGNGAQHKTITLDDIDYCERVFGDAGEDMPNVARAPVLFRDTKGLNLGVTENEKRLLELMLRGGIGVGQELVWNKISFYHMAVNWFFRKDRMADVICVVWSATDDPDQTPSLLEAINTANNALAVPVQIFLIVTMPDKLAAMAEFNGNERAADREVQRRARKAATLLGISANHTFVVTNVCKDSAQTRHNSFVDQKLLKIFSRIMHSGANIRRRR